MVACSGSQCLLLCRVCSDLVEEDLDRGQETNESTEVSLCTIQCQLVPRISFSANAAVLFCCTSSKFGYFYSSLSDSNSLFN